MSSKTYKKLDSITHIHTRPDMYIGTNKLRVMEHEFICKEDRIELETEIGINDGFIRIFLEALSNAIDNYYRSKDGNTPMTKLMVSLDEETGKTEVWNDGNHIPVEIHEEEGIYIPELIFGHLLSGSNYNDEEERLTSGRNGLGIKLLNVFSREFSIECFDNERGLVYKQTWKEHMKKCLKAKILNKNGKSGYTKISWIPDFSLFSMDGYDQNHISSYKKYVYDAAMIMKIPVYWNKEKISIKKFSDYVKFYSLQKGNYIEGVIENGGTTLEYCICEASCGIQHISFINGIFTREGGVHVDNVQGELLKVLCQKLSKLKITPKDIKHYFTIFINATVINPEFSSQSKTKMVSCKSPLKVEFPNKVYNHILKWDFINDIIEMNKMKDILSLKKSEKKRGYKRIDGLDPANFAGTKQSKDCILILCEGLSAKTYSTKGITKGFDNKKGRNYFGIYPLRGKCLNVRNASLSSITNNKEITDIIHTLNLRFNIDYTKEEEFKTLTYGKVCIITDADEDGHHICSLLLNFFHKLFPSLLQRDPPFFCIMMTPIAKIKWSKNSIESYYNDFDYQNALQSTNSSKFEVKYYKGLGTSSDSEIKESFGEKVVCFLTDEQADLQLNMIFHKNCSLERKNWLLTHNAHNYQVPDKEYPITLYLNQELIKFSLEDCKRSIPCLFDGLKVSQRKILFSVFRKGLSYTGKSMKVAQLAGYCAEQSNYHHGEQCLYETIIKMSHYFPGSNNLPYFERDGQFGSRVYGGKDAANARYIFTKLGPVTRYLFPSEDDILLDYTLDDGTKVQPDFYLPILPTVLINGCTAGIGTGWSCYIPCFRVLDILEKVKLFLKGTCRKFELKPYYDDFDGKIEKISENKYQTIGILKEKIDRKKKVYEICELPIGTWTDRYKEELETLQENKKIKNLKNYSTTEKVHFEFEEGTEKMNINEDTLKLKTNLNLTNMVMFVEEDKIQKFDTIYSIFIYYCKKRLDLYQRRIEYLQDITNKNLEMVENKSKFIVAVVKKEIELFNKSEEVIENLLKTKKYKKIEDSYDYLLRIPLRDLTKNKYEQLKNKIKEYKEYLEKLKNITPQEMWSEDLENFEKEYRKYYQ